ncbi:hypothetical protein [Mucilaginibacter sp. R-33]|uniref:hypothetical protein n=1 Tax=unclassified Mucilaginibacter TaxID=2617802 RepID=UPI003CFA9DA4
MNRSVVQTLLFGLPADVKRAGIKTGSPEIKLKTDGKRPTGTVFTIANAILL